MAAEVLAPLFLRSSVPVPRGSLSTPQEMTQCTGKPSESCLEGACSRLADNPFSGASFDGRSFVLQWRFQIAVTTGVLHVVQPATRW
jgi:hypothetical protein